MKPPAPSGAFRLGEWLVEPSLNRISKGGVVAPLRPKLMDLLVVLAGNAGRVLTKDEIIEHVWERQFIAESVLSHSIADLRQLLHDDPGQPRFIRTIPKRGYCLIAPVARDERALRPAPRKPSVAVLPFTDLAREKDQEYFCDGLAEELTNALARINGLRVVARTSAFAFKGKAVDAREIGRQLNVNAVLEGGVQRSESHLRITVQLIDTADGCHIWSERFDRRAGDVFAIEDELAQAVSAALRLKLMPSDEARLMGRYTCDPEAYDLYLKGRHLWGRRTAEAIAEAVTCFRRALERDPGYALAHAALGECYATSGFLGYLAPRTAFPSAKAAAEKALALDSTLGEAHAILGFAAGVYDWSWAEAENHFARAAECGPSHAQSPVWHSNVLACTARFDEALAEIHRAWELDPLSPLIQANLGFIMVEARQYQAAAARCLKTLDLHPGFPLAHFHLGRAYHALDRFDEALVHLEKAAPGFPLAMALLASAWAKTGRPDKAREILRELEKLSAERYVGPLVFASVHLGLGDADTALQWYEKAFDARDGIVPLLNVDFFVDPLRSHPKFQALLTRLRVPCKTEPRPPGGQPVNQNRSDTLPENLLH